MDVGLDQVGEAIFTVFLQLTRHIDIVLNPYLPGVSFVTILLKHRFFLILDNTLRGIFQLMNL